MPAPAAARIGISGWRYPPWRGTFYPAELQQRRELEFASRALSTIEINGSFYSLQLPKSWQAWHDATPADFVFSVKGPKFITHVLRLREPRTALANFFASGIANLRGKLGPILWQLPPNFKFDADLLRAFFALLPRDTDAASALAKRHDDKVARRCVLRYGAPARPLRHALEVRNESFVTPSFIALLRKAGVAFVVADTADRWPQFVDVTSDFVYVRLHGATALYNSRYSDDELKRWAARIGHWREGGGAAEGPRIARPAAKARGGRDVYCYFDNTDKVHAPDNARRLAAMLGGAPAPAALTAGAPRPRRATRK